MKFLIVGLLVSWKVFAGEVVFLKDHVQKRKSCSQWLSQNKNSSASILPFESRNPDYVNSRTFFRGKAPLEENVFYLYSTGTPDFSRSSQESWQGLPQVSHAREIYVLKVSGFDGSFAEKFSSKKTWKISEIREEARLVSFTKIRVHPLFGVIKLLIEQVRGLECHHKNMRYQTPKLLDEEALADGADKVKMGRFLNSWVPISLNEEAIKEAAKGFFANEFKNHEEKKAVQSFLTFMEKELLRLYTPEQVHSALFYVSGRSL